MRSLFLLSVAIVVVACAGPTPRMPGAIEPGVPDPSSPAAGATAAADPTIGAFAWSSERRLTWADFQGPPDLASEAAALTAYVVSYDTTCDRDRFTARVVSRFLPRASWVKPRHLLDRASAQTLQHEQVHFDLSEVQARRARKALRDLSYPCTLSDADLDRMFDRFGAADAEIQRQYDRDTAHGTDASRQREWTQRVDTWLRDLPR